MMQGDEETITLTKSKMKETVSKAVTSAVNKIWTEISSTQVFAINVDMETHLQKELKSALLEAELQLLFPELGLIRKNIVIKSFLLNHSQEFEPSQTYELQDIKGLKFDYEETITVCADIDVEDIQQFEQVNLYLNKCLNIYIILASHTGHGRLSYKENEQRQKEQKE